MLEAIPIKIVLVSLLLPGIGGIKEIHDQVIRLHEKGPKRVTEPMTLSKALPNMASGNVTMGSWS